MKVADGVLPLRLILVTPMFVSRKLTGKKTAEKTHLLLSFSFLSFFFLGGGLGVGTL